MMGESFQKRYVNWLCNRNYDKSSVRSVNYPHRCNTTPARAPFESSVRVVVTLSWQFGVIAALSAFNAISRVTSQCSSIETCFEGGATSTPCSISSGGCPPCITFADDGCYVKVNNACPFGVDCASAWESSTAASTGSGTTTTTSNITDTSGTPASSDTDPSTSTASNSSLTPSPNSNSSTDTSSSDPTSFGSSNGSNTGADDSDSGGSDMSVVFAIIGAAIGVIAVAVIFLTLVRRSKAAHDEDEDVVPNTPVTFTKGQGPQSTTGAAMYASYNNGTQSAAPSFTSEPGVSASAMSYYNQQPLHNTSAPSPRVAGRAIPSQPVGLNQSTNKHRPYGSSQNVGTPGVGITNDMIASGIGGTSQTHHTPVQHQHLGGAAPSPHTRRESFEF
ncbi:hypothetical protein Plhal304r1_c034g0107831 [Plasmopara halstedii]